MTQSASVSANPVATDAPPDTRVDDVPIPSSATHLFAQLRSQELWLPAWSLWRREMMRFFRQRNRVIGALATPLVFWLLLGLGMSGSFQTPGAGLAEPGPGYLEYFYPGTVVMILLFTAIFATITVIEDRREGFLQGVMAAPIPRLSIVLGKVLGGASIATIQGALFLLIWPLIVGLPSGAGWLWAPMHLAMTLVMMFIVAMGLTGLGFCLAWPMDSTAGFHAIMNLLLMPMWFLCGAVFPVDSAPLAMRFLMWLNPLTYGQAAFAGILRGGESHVGAPVPVWLAALVTLALTVAVIALASRIVDAPRKDGQA